LCLVWLLMGFLLFSGLASKQIHYLIPLLPAFALLVAWVLVHTRQTVSPGWELAMPAVFGVIGLFLLMLPRVPGLAELQWVQTVEPGWGLAVLGVAVVLGMIVLLIGRLAVMQLSLAVVFSVFLSFMCFFKYTGLAFDLRPAALLLKTLNDQEKPCAFVGNYQGQLHFLGRLTQPLPSLTNAQAGVWGSLHPDGYLITLEKQKPVDAYYQQPHREYWLVFRSSTQFARLKPL